MNSSLTKKNTTRFLIYSFVGLLVFSMGVFAMLGIYMSRKSTKTIHEVGEIYMSGMSEQMARHFENIIELRFAEVEGIVSVVPSKSADKEAMYADLVYRAQVRGFEYLALCSPNGRFETLCGEAFQPVNPPTKLCCSGSTRIIRCRTAKPAPVWSRRCPWNISAIFFFQKVRMLCSIAISSARTEAL